MNFISSIKDSTYPYLCDLGSKLANLPGRVWSDLTHLPSITQSNPFATVTVIVGQLGLAALSEKIRKALPKHAFYNKPLCGISLLDTAMITGLNVGVAFAANVASKLYVITALTIATLAVRVLGHGIMTFVKLPGKFEKFKHECTNTINSLNIKLNGMTKPSETSGSGIPNDIPLRPSTLHSDDEHVVDAAKPAEEAVPTAPIQEEPVVQQQMQKAATPTQSPVEVPKAATPPKTEKEAAVETQRPATPPTVTVMEEKKSPVELPKVATPPTTKEAAESEEDEETTTAPNSSVVNAQNEESAPRAATPLKTEEAVVEAPRVATPKAEVAVEPQVTVSSEEASKVIQATTEDKKSPSPTKKEEVEVKAAAA